MKLSAKIKQAVDALACLESQQQLQKGAVSIKQLCLSSGAPQPCLEQIFHQLKKASIVEGKRGPHGGYRICRPLSTLSLYELYLCLNEPIRFKQCPQYDAGQQNKRQCRKRCPSHELWNTLETLTKELLKTLFLKPSGLQQTLSPPINEVVS